MKAARRVVLVGAGHAHVEVLRQWSLDPPPRVELTLIVDRNPAIYSGMVPGLVAGQYAARDLEIDAITLAGRGARVLVEPATAIDVSGQAIHTASGEKVGYDWASLDVGSSVVGSDLPGVAEHALPARPMQRLLAGIDTLVERACALPHGESFRLLVVGAGAGGVELAFCFEARLRRALQRPVDVMLLDRGSAPLVASPPGLAKRALRVLARRHIEFRGSAEVRALDGASALLADGERLEADAVIWAPGPAAHAFQRDSDLPLDRDGFVRIRPTLQIEGNDRLFAVGDCASLAGMRKAGVYAVRSGPILSENLRRALAGNGLRAYEPQSEFLSLLNLGDGTALGVKWGITFEGRWVMRLKDRIDRRFMERYQ